MSKGSRIFGPERARRGDTAGDTQHQPLDSLWDENADKYKCCCRTLHVTRATLYIAYAQMVLTSVFSLFFTFYYVQAVSGRLEPDHWINQLGERYIFYISASLLFAVTLQLLLVLLLVHGLRTERRSFLLPFIVFASIAILLGFAQVFLNLLFYFFPFSST
ncbi:unnamed protein product [Gongylonema pulchrum]|uniref:Uncharacterized protein n=1 Tax=Gongylonema pulchrum TaxID=637853 RepID=A0A183EKL8_9BILA|nr:unnamed protein product [Gongylonema pulchrum]